MKILPPRRDGQTRPVFRILAGIVAAFILLVSLPLALYEAITATFVGWETLLNWFMVLCCIYAGIGLAVGARTGRWFNSPG